MLNPIWLYGDLVLSFNNGGTAGYLSGNGTSTFTLLYLIGPNDKSTSDLSYVAANSLVLSPTSSYPSPSALDAEGHSLNLTLPALRGPMSLDGNKTLVIDMMRVINVMSLNKDGTYGAGDAIVIAVFLSDSVTVDTTNGRPYLILEIGPSADYAYYDSGSGTAELIFIYYPSAGQNATHLRYPTTASLIHNTTSSGLILARNVTLPWPGGAHSLDYNNWIVIDTSAATIVSVTASPCPSGTSYKSVGSG